ncbi:MAG: ester cyclase [Anaerolineales bacterium]|nr:ester cyclase [Anaerolineales bacterium]
MGFAACRVAYDALDALFTPGYREHQFGLHPDLEGFKRDLAFLRSAFPDLRLTIEDMADDGDKVWVRITALGTNRGAGFMGPPNGKAFEMTVRDVCRFENNRIVEHWGAPDRFALLAQLDLLPRRPGSSEAPAVPVSGALVE